MKTRELIDRLREVLKPQGTADVVRLNLAIHYYNGDFVTKCIDFIETRMMMFEIGLGDELNPLEHLAVDVLLQSAGIKLPLPKGE